MLRLAEIAGGNDEVLRQVEPLVAGSETGQAGRGASSRRCSTRVAAAGVPAERVRLDVSIARGLDYYTGTIFETFLDALPGIGSVCSGGRYDNLAELYHQPGIARHRGLARAGPAAGGDGRVGHGRKGRHARPGLHSLFRRSPRCTTTCVWRRRCARRASAWRSFPSRRSSASS